MATVTGITVTVRGTVNPLVTSLASGMTTIPIAADRSWSLAVNTPGTGASTIVPLTAVLVDGQVQQRSILVEGGVAPAPAGSPVAPSAAG